MNVLTKKDLELIGAEVAKVIEDNVDPRLDTIETRLSVLEGDMKAVKTTMVTKGYLDDKLGDLRGDLIANDRKLEHRMDRLIEGAGREELETLRIFPLPDATFGPKR